MSKRLLTAGLALWTLPAMLAAQQIGFIEHQVPSSLGSAPNGITHGPDGALWFTIYLPNDVDVNSIGRMAKSGTVTAFPLPTPNAIPINITTGSDGALWFTEFDASQIGRITTDGTVSEYPVPGGVNPYGIAPGPDGALWFTAYPGLIGRITTAGAVSTYGTPTPESAPQNITAGPDGALWFTESPSLNPAANNIGRITMAGVITEYPTPTANSSPSGIAAGPDSAIWFTEAAGNRIGRITSEGTITEFSVPTPASLPNYICAGPEGSLWFTEYNGNNIVRITTSGVITEYAVPSQGSEPDNIVAVPGGLWFSEWAADKVGQLVFQSAASSVNPEVGKPGSPVTVIGSGFAAGETIRVSENSTSLNPAKTTTADLSGAFDITSHIPESPFGANSLVSVGQSSGRVAVAQFSTEALVTVTPKVVAPGSTITIEGFGFNPGGTATVFLGKPSYRDFLSKQQTDARGSFATDGSLTYRISDGAQPGFHLISVESNSSDGSSAFLATAEFTVR